MNLALEIKNIFDKEQITDRNGNIISDIDDLTALQTIELAKKYPDTFYLYWKCNQIPVGLTEVFGEFLVICPKAWEFVRRNKIKLGVGSWYSILEAYDLDELEEYACDIDSIPRKFVQELVIADGENLNKLQGNKPARYWMDSFFYQNPHVDVLYVIRHCQKNVETLYETIFNYNNNTDNIKTLLMADAKFGELVEEYSTGIELPVPDALRILRKHPDLINLEIMPTDKFSKQQWQSLQTMHPDNPNLTKTIKAVL